MEKTRKAQETRAVIEEEARLRMSDGGKIDPVGLNPQGKARDIVAKKTGFGDGRAYEQAEQVVEDIERKRAKERMGRCGSSSTGKSRDIVATTIGTLDAPLQEAFLVYILKI